MSGLWRVDACQPRNIYLDNVMVGVMVGAEATAAALARAVVNTMNGGDLRPVGRSYGGYPSGAPTGKAPDVPQGPAPGMRTRPIDPPVTLAPGQSGVVRIPQSGDGPAEVVVAAQCGTPGPDRLRCERAPSHHGELHGAYRDEPGELVRW